MSEGAGTAKLLEEVHSHLCSSALFFAPHLLEGHSQTLQNRESHLSWRSEQCPMQLLLMHIVLEHVNLLTWYTVS